MRSSRLATARLSCGPGKRLSAHCCDLINDVRQRPINTLCLQLSGPGAFQGTKQLGIAMSMISIAMVSLPKVRADYHSCATTALFCCFGLVVSLCLMTLGADLTAV